MASRVVVALVVALTNAAVLGGVGVLGTHAASAEYERGGAEGPDLDCGPVTFIARVTVASLECVALIDHALSSLPFGDGQGTSPVTPARWPDEYKMSLRGSDLSQSTGVGPIATGAASGASGTALAEAPFGAWAYEPTLDIRCDAILRLDRNDRPHLACNVGGDGTYYAYKDGLAWPTTLLPDHYSPRFFLDGEDVPHILSQRKTGELLYSSIRDGAWFDEVVVETRVAWRTLALGPGGEVAAAFSIGTGHRYKEYETFYAIRRSPGVWEFERVGTGIPGESTDWLAFDPQGVPHLVGFNFNDPTDGWSDPMIRYASRNVDGSWVQERIRGCDRDAAIAFAPDGTPHVSCRRFPDRVIHATTVGGTWEVEEAIGLTDYRLAYAGPESLAVDAAGRPHLVLWTFGGCTPTLTEATTLYMMKGTAGWVTEKPYWPILSNWCSGNSFGANLALDRLGFPHVVYGAAGDLLHPFAGAEPELAAPLAATMLRVTAPARELVG